MEIKLIQTQPKVDGYYLVKFDKNGGLHLVLIQTEIDGTRIIFPDICPFKNAKNKNLKCLSDCSHLYYNQFPMDAWWSEGPIVIGE